jgi:hypothetical protein
MRPFQPEVEVTQMALAVQVGHVSVLSFLSCDNSRTMSSDSRKPTAASSGLACWRTCRSVLSSWNTTGTTGTTGSETLTVT